MSIFHRRVVLPLLLCLMLSCMWVADGTAVDRPVGLIVTVDGEVIVARGDRRRPGVEGFVLEPGDTIIVRIGGTCGGFGLDGERFKLKGPGEIVLSIPSPEGTVDKIRAYITRQLAQWSGTSRSRSLVSRSVREWEITVHSPAPIIPAPDGSVRASRSRFYWTVVSSVDRYIVTIAQEKGEELEQAIRGNTVVQEDLQPGNTYLWKIRAQGDKEGMGSQWSSFRVMTPEEERELDEVVTGLTDLEAGVFLLSAGLHGEAIYRFDAAVASGVDRNSALRWRAEALAAIRLYKEAYDDLVETIER